MSNITTENEMSQTVAEALEMWSEEMSEDQGINPVVENIIPFDEAGLLTNDKGIEVTLENGGVYHITIQKVN